MTAYRRAARLLLVLGILASWLAPAAWDAMARHAGRVHDWRSHQAGWGVADASDHAGCPLTDATGEVSRLPGEATAQVGCPTPRLPAHHEPTPRLVGAPGHDADRSRAPPAVA